MILLTKEDFKGGKYDIPDSSGYYTSDDLQECIDKFETDYIYQLLGVSMGDDFISWIQTDPLPVNIPLSTILNRFAFDNTTECFGIMVSAGIKEFLKAAVFFEYNKNGLKTSQAGISDLKAEVSTIQSVSSTIRFAENKFNELLSTVEAIQWYCNNNPDDYPDFNGQHISVKYANFF